MLHPNTLKLKLNRAIALIYKISHYVLKSLLENCHEKCIVPVTQRLVNTSNGGEGGSKKAGAGVGILGKIK